MAILKLAALGTLGYVAYKYIKAEQQRSPAAFATNEHAGENFAKVRSAGPSAMADPPAQGWSKVDQRVDESFPASDPPSTY